MARPRDYGRGAGNHKIKCSPPGNLCSREIPRVAHCTPERGTSFSAAVTAIISGFTLSAGRVRRAQII